MKSIIFLPFFLFVSLATFLSGANYFANAQESVLIILFASLVGSFLLPKLLRMFFEGGLHFSTLTPWLFAPVLFFVLLAIKLNYLLLHHGLVDMYAVLNEWVIFSGYLFALISITVWVLVLSVVLGKFILKLFRGSAPYQGFSLVVVQFALGQAALMLLMTILGFLGFLYSVVVYTFFIILTLVLRKTIWEYISWVYGLRIKLSPCFRVGGDNDKNVSSLNWLWLSVMLISVSSFVFMAVNSLTIHPYVTDTLRAYSSLPDLYTQEHAIVDYPGSGIFYDNYPKYAEMLFALGIMLFDHNVNNFLILIYLLMSLGMITIISKECAPKNKITIPLLAPVLLLVPAIMFFGYGNAKVDIIMLLFILISAYLGIRYAKEGNKNILMVMGVCAGIAIGTKYTAVVSLAAILFGLVFLIKNHRKLIMVWFLVPLIAVVVFLPWGVRNYVSVGNPVAPILFSQVNNKDTVYHQIGDDSIQQLLQSARDSSYYQLFNREVKDIKYYLGLPLRILVNDSGLSMKMNEFGPFFITLCILLLSREIYRNKYIRYLSIVILIHLFLYLVVIENTVVWYILPAFVLLISLYERLLSNRSNEMKRMVLYAVLYMGMVSLVTNAQIQPFSLVGVDETTNLNDTGERSDYSFSRFAQLRQMAIILEQKEYSTGKIFFVNDSAVYFINDFHERVISSIYIEIFGYYYDKGYTNSEIRNALQELGVRFLIVNKGQIEVNKKLILNSGVHSPNIMNHYLPWYGALENFVKEESQEIYGSSVYSLYELND